MRDLTDVRDAMRRFAAERDWDQFHSPRNLAMALSVEAGELMEHFLWTRDTDIPARDSRQLSEIGAELADVFLYTVRLADRLGIDLLAASAAKMASNAERYPADLVRGQSKKYTEY
jgi:NTP pyrophosphatase (non-canonical NTP hydrolase)